MKAIEKNKTWEMVPLPRGCKPIGLKLKKNTKGEIVRHKAHIVIKGYVQKHGIDFEEVFAIVALMELV